MKRILTGIGLLAILAGFLIWWLHPHQVLKRRTKGLMETLTLVEGAGPASRNLKIYPLARAIADEVEISGSGDRRSEGAFNRSQIESGFSWLTRNARFTRFQIRRIESVTRSGDTGVVRALIDAEVILQQETPLQGPYFMTLTWQNADNKWRLVAAEWHQQ